ncbi:molybdenum cofactor guanylyltransferase MobA [Roseateles amylovorans]|uniref:Molybdenum cofactor guanylyltransferase n=1 Tax=Roseateles amylovorans TaxID=2978473 RepID=A0ABY6B400_9BURK|nr:molybdenum cofactor guanylyltransferase MobA [Roseateles amylovorans]UXH79915.1 molybdenum cofactor guanylyltransferase [Roseateles amylovorans]
MPPPAPAPAARAITAVLLCGGRGSRMGGVDKPLQAFQGRPLVEHVLARIAPQVNGRVVLSANRHLDDYRRYGHPVVTDSWPDYPGPLAGLLAGMDAVQALQAAAMAAQAPHTPSDTAAGAPPSDHWLLCVSGDSPWLPEDLASRLQAALTDGHDSAMALGREAPDTPLRSQPLASLVHLRHRDALQAALQAGERRVEAWLRSLPLVLVPFDRPSDDRAFANINDRSELERLEPRPHP